MKKEHRRKVIFILFIICCASITYSYASPSEDIEGAVGIRIVTNDDIGPNFLNGGILTPSGSNPDVEGSSDPNYSSGDNSEGKNVASTASENIGYRFSLTDFNNVEKMFYEKIDITMDNVYPWYSSGVTFQIGSYCDFPIKIETLSRNILSGDPEILDFSLLIIAIQNFNGVS